jgi:hypothetical protein
MRRIAEEKSSEVASIDEDEAYRMDSVSAIVWFSLAITAALILTYL